MIYDKQAVTIFANTLKTLSMFTKRKFSITTCRLGGKKKFGSDYVLLSKRNPKLELKQEVICVTFVIQKYNSITGHKNVATFDLFHSYCIHLLNLYPIF